MGCECWSRTTSPSNITNQRACPSLAGRSRAHSSLNSLKVADDLEMGRGVALRTLLQELHRGVDTALAVRDAGNRQTHLHPRQRSEQGEFVAFTEMADPKHLARDLRQARPERHVEVVEHDLSELVGVVSRR